MEHMNYVNLKPEIDLNVLHKKSTLKIVIQLTGVNYDTLVAYFYFISFQVWQLSRPLKAAMLEDSTSSWVNSR